LDGGDAAPFNEVALRYIRSWTPTALAVFAIYYALLIGALNIVRVLGRPFDVIVSDIDRHVNVATWQGSTAHALLLGVFMLFIASQLRLRKRAALVVFSAFIVLQTIADVARGMSHLVGASTIMLGALLLLAAPAMRAQPDPSALNRFRVLLPLAAVVFFSYGTATLYFLQGRFDIHEKSVLALAYRTVAVAAGGTGVALHGWTLAFRDSLAVMLAFGLLYLGYLLFRPYREPVRQDPADHERAASLIRRYGADSLAYFNSRRDKNLFFHGEDIFIAYRQVGGVAVMSGDPIGPVELFPEILERFGRFCADRGWRQMSLGSRGDYLGFYEDAGLKGFLLGEEAILHLDEFTLEGRRVRKLRQSVNKMERNGFHVEFMYNAGIPAHVRHELRRISSDWRGDKPETGFSMGLGRLLDAEDPECLLCLAYDSAQQPVGFLYMVPMYPHLGYSLDITRTSVGAPNSLSEFMLATTALFLKENGYRFMSLHFLALSQSYRDDREEPGSPFMRGIAKALSRFIPIISAYHFDRKFSPHWKKRYMLYRSILDFPAVCYAGFTVESALKVARPADRKRLNGSCDP
jgi:lysyl-tRNA synthetase class 2